MKNYTSLSSSPNYDYMAFNNTQQMRKNMGLGGGFVSGGEGLGGGGSPISSSFIGTDKREVHESREIRRNSPPIIPISRSQTLSENMKSSSYNLYSSEDIININGVKPKCDELSSIILPFYPPIIDIVISKHLHVEIVDHSSGNEKNKDAVICSGKLKKYRFNGHVRNYDIYVEFVNENVYHVKKRGIMMKTSVHDELRKHIIKTMVNYVADGGDVDPKPSLLDGGCGGGSEGMIVKGKTKKKWFSFLSCFDSAND